MDLNTSEQNVAAGSALMPGLVDLQKFMFSDRYHLTPSVLARVCPSMTGFMLWITSFNRCRMSLLLLLLNASLKVRAVYLKGDPTISVAFQCAACTAGAPPTCTSSSSTNFLAWPRNSTFLLLLGPWNWDPGKELFFFIHAFLSN